MSKKREVTCTNRPQADLVERTGPLDFPDPDPFELFQSFESSASSTAHDDAGGVAATAKPETTTTYTRSRDTRHMRTKAGKSAVTESSPQPRSLKARALGHLSRREYSRAELSRKLAPFADETSCLDTLLDTLEREGWLSDSRFVESLVHRRASRLGAARIAGELKRHAVDPSLIEAMNTQLRGTELSRAQAVWNKKYGQLPTTPAERARQIRFLVARGFSQAIVGKILKGVDDEWEEG